MELYILLLLLVPTSLVDKFFFYKYINNLVNFFLRENMVLYIQ
ncbi:uncharacterized protein METZ01_LOCUS2415 [marine metagenome]|uniref:Uncharacterized protein n=1 Tax=marine metagenome TaxID=408172 RepID=A0A381N4M1_9ZZZZ